MLLQLSDQSRHQPERRRKNMVAVARHVRQLAFPVSLPKTNGKHLHARRLQLVRRAADVILRDAVSEHHEDPLPRPRVSPPKQIFPGEGQRKTGPRAASGVAHPVDTALDATPRGISPEVEDGDRPGRVQDHAHSGVARRNLEEADHCFHEVQHPAEVARAASDDAAGAIDEEAEVDGALANCEQ